MNGLWDEDDEYSRIKDDFVTSTTIDDLKHLYLEVGDIAFNNMKRFAPKDLVEEFENEKNKSD